MILLSLAVFLGSLSFVFISTKAWFATEARNAHLAATLDSVLDGMEWLFIILLVRTSLWLAVPSILGTYLGTYIAVQLAKRKTS